MLYGDSGYLAILLKSIRVFIALLGIMLALNWLFSINPHFTLAGKNSFKRKWLVFYVVILISYFIDLGGFYYSLDLFIPSLKKINHKNGQ